MVERLGLRACPVAMDFFAFSELVELLAGRIVDRSGNGLVNFLNSEPGEHSGPWADFKYARSAMRDGEWAEAVRLMKIELEKEPENYEGLLLLASIYAHMGKHGRVVQTLDELLKVSTLTDEQVSAVKLTRENYVELMKGS
jgi:predicted Zn-dependent protease